MGNGVMLDCQAVRSSFQVQIAVQDRQPAAKGCVKVEAGLPSTTCDVARK